MASPSPSSNTSSGIIIDPSSGARHIPSSTRPDGSKRKEIKIRPGYKPPEDVEVYKNRTAEAWKTRGAEVGVPGAEGLTTNADMKATNAKTAKRREARKKAKASEASTNDDGIHIAEAEPQVNGIEIGASSSAKCISTGSENRPANAPKPIEPPDPEVEKEKQARNLKKKLRQARELREKKDKGEDLLPEQFEKVIKIKELIRQLDKLGFNAEGERKKD